MRILRLPLLAALCAAFACLPLVHTASAESRGYTPPHATDARNEPARFPEELEAERLAALRTRHSVYLGLARYETLDREATQLMLDYSAKRITGDEFVDQMASFAPLLGGEADLPQLQAWAEASPKSYAAWYALGREYLELAMNARGLTHEVREASAKYAEQADVALNHSLEFSAKPLPSLVSLMSLQAYGGPFEFDPAARVARPACNLPEVVRETAHRLCGKGWHDVQYQILQSIVRLDPNVLAGYATYFLFNNPRWGGKYLHLREVIADARQSGRMNPPNLAELQAMELGWEASDAHDPMREADLYIQAFDANPQPGHLRRLYAAADAAKRVRNIPFALKIYDRIIQIRPTEYEALFERAERSEDEYHDHNRLFADLAESARLGMKESQNDIGYAYLTGYNGFPVDLQEARRWLMLAANQGYQHSREKLPVVDELIAEQVRKAASKK
jgi:hypothetical protein